MGALLLITRRTTCPKCDGQRTILNPAWDRWMESAKSWSQDKRPDKGLINIECMVNETWTIPCPDCNGQGHIDRTVTLEAALDELKVVRKGDFDD